MNVKAFSRIADYVFVPLATTTILLPLFILRVVTFGSMADFAKNNPDSWIVGSLIISISYIIAFGVALYLAIKAKMVKNMTDAYVFSFVTLLVLSIWRAIGMTLSSTGDYYTNGGFSEAGEVVLNRIDSVANVIIVISALIITLLMTSKNSPLKVKKTR